MRLHRLFTSDNPRWSLQNAGQMHMLFHGETAVLKTLSRLDLWSGPAGELLSACSVGTSLHSTGLQPGDSGRLVSSVALLALDLSGGPLLLSHLAGNQHRLTGYPKS